MKKRSLSVEIEAVENGFIVRICRCPPKEEVIGTMNLAAGIDGLVELARKFGALHEGHRVIVCRTWDEVREQMAALGFDLAHEDAMAGVEFKS